MWLLHSHPGRVGRGLLSSSGSGAPSPTDSAGSPPTAAAVTTLVPTPAPTGTGVTTPTHHGNGIYTFSGGQIPVGNDHWKLVRRVQAGSTWHPATDHLAGTTASGTYSTDLVSSSTFSIQFDELECSHFLFSTGDMQKWLVAAAEEMRRTCTL